MSKTILALAAWGACAIGCAGHPDVGQQDSPLVGPDGGACQTQWPLRGCDAESQCACGDGTTQQFGCIGPPSCGDACCGHAGPAPVDADSGMSQCPTSWPVIPCEIATSCQCADGTTQGWGCAGLPPSCADACCTHGGPGP
jgi:hypothetical protein